LSGTVFFDAVAAISEAHAARPFLTTADGPSLSHADMLRRTARIARALALPPGERVAVMLGKSPEAVLAYLACLRAGLIYIPINPDFRAEEVGHILADVQPALVLCDAGREAWMAACGPARVLSLPALLALAAGASPLESAHGGDAPAVILYTSGTTGRPKGAMLSGQGILTNGLALSRFWQFTERDVLLHVVPLFHSHGLFVSLSCTLLSGSVMLMTPRFAADEVLRLLPRASVFMAVPTMVSRLLAQPGLDRAACATIRLFACGSAPLSPADFAAFAARTGHEIVERYGMSETGINASNPIDGPRIPGSVGPPLPGVEIEIAAADGEVGAVRIRGPHLFTGYRGQPAQTAEAIDAQGWFTTGDLGRLDAAGYLHLVGRTKELIITGGYNVYPTEVERVLQDLPGVAEAAVFGLPHPDFGEAVTAVLVAHPGVILDEARLIAAARERLAPYKTPKRVLIEPALPRNAVGKVVKAALQKRLDRLHFPGPADSSTIGS